MMPAIRRPAARRARRRADSGRAAYLEQCREKILGYEHGDVAVLKWWASDEQHRARRAFALTQGEVDYLKNVVTTRLPKRTA